MRKIEIFKEVSGKTGIESAQVETIIEAFMASVKEHVISKETVSLNGFGNFIVKQRAAKVARNISKNTAMTLPAYFAPVFRPSKVFSERVKKNAKQVNPD